MDELPDEIVFHILTYLRIKDLSHIFRLNRRYNSFMYDSVLWRTLIFRDFPSVINFPQPSFLLYKYLSTRKVGKANTICVPKNVYPAVGNWMPKQINKICKNAEVLKYVESNGAERGDMIYLESHEVYKEEGYWNEGILLYNGSKVVPLDYTIDSEYGSIPEEFQVIDEFPINYWDGKLVQCNYYAYFRVDRYIDEIHNNIKLLKGDKGKYVSYFRHWSGYVFHIIVSSKLFTLSNENIYYDSLREKLLKNIFICRPNNTLYLFLDN